MSYPTPDNATITIQSDPKHVLQSVTVWGLLISVLSWALQLGATKLHLPVLDPNSVADLVLNVLMGSGFVTAIIGRVRATQPLTFRTSLPSAGKTVGMLLLTSVMLIAVGCSLDKQWSATTQPNDAAWGQSLRSYVAADTTLTEGQRQELLGHFSNLHWPADRSLIDAYEHYIQADKSLTPEQLARRERTVQTARKLAEQYGK